MCNLQAVAFVLNLQMQQQRDPKTEAEEADRRRQQTDANRDEIRRTLEADNLWTESLALDLDELAQQKTFIDRLTEQMQAPGYQDTFTLPKKDGTMIPTLNPLHEYRDTPCSRDMKTVLLMKLSFSSLSRKSRASSSETVCFIMTDTCMFSLK